MKTVVLSTGQTAVIRTKDELTEGQSRKIEIARARGSAVFNKFGAKTGDSMVIAPGDMDKLSDEDFVNISGFEDAAICVLTVSLNGEDVGDPTQLTKAIYQELSDIVLSEYAGVAVSTESVDEKIDPLVVAAESTESSTEAQT